jgi:hypothetical protein
LALLETLSTATIGSNTEDAAARFTKEREAGIAWKQAKWPQEINPA